MGHFHAYLITRVNVYMKHILCMIYSYLKHSLVLKYSWCTCTWCNCHCNAKYVVVNMFISFSTKEISMYMEQDGYT